MSGRVREARREDPALEGLRCEEQTGPQNNGWPSAVYLASGRSEHLNGHRLVATEWSPEDPDGRPASDGIGV